MDGFEKPCTLSTDLQIGKLWLQKVYMEEKMTNSFSLKGGVRS